MIQAKRSSEDKYNNNGETLHVEFKEFYFKYITDQIYSYDRLINIFTAKIWDDSIESEIQTHLNLYFNHICPKYIAGYFNAKIAGKLVIGVSDSGIIKGIPTILPLSNESVLERIKFNIKNKLMIFLMNDIFDDTTIENIIDSLLSVNVISLCDDKSECNHFNIEHIIAENKRIEIYNDSIQQKFDSDYSLWESTYDEYKCRLNKFINNTKIRSELISYILDDKEFYLYQHIIDILNNPSIIEIPNGKLIDIEKNDKLNLIYWIVNFKDLKIQQLLNIRPKKELLQKLIRKSPLLMFKNISSISNSFSPRPKKYIIEINIKKNNLNNIRLLYKTSDSKISQWRYCKRKINKFGIVCCEMETSYDDTTE
jgi:hypothetical protein